nr:Na+/H+ antiporter NhaA [Planctomycetota bacterium]
MPRIFASIAALFRSPVAPGVALLAATAAALILANGPLAVGFRQSWDMHLVVAVDGHGVDKSLGHWISDGLMAIFFFVVGLELKREILVGHLSSARRAALPIVAACGGMIAPALIFAAINLGQDGVPRAWGVPIATDIAFAIGVLSLLGTAIPVSLRIFLVALAIADDVGAVLVIALFYTDGIAWPQLAGGGAALALSLALNRSGVRWPLPYALLGIVMWVLFLESGIHATIAGVLLALTIPTASTIDTRAFAQSTRALIDRFADAGENEPHIMTNDERQGAVHRIERHCERVR